MKILLVDNFQIENEEPKFSGVTYYRMIKPHTVLRRLNTEVEFSLINGITEGVSDEMIKEYDFILFSRSIGNYEDIDGIVERLNKIGIPFGLDLDDHWQLSKDHILNDYYKENKISEAIFKSVQAAHFVICTTPILAGHIKEVNKNVHVIENGIDTQDPSWFPNKKQSNRLRFGFTQGTTHFTDLIKIAESIRKSFKDPKFYNNAQIVLCGFDGKPNEPSMYIGYERLITEDLKLILDRTYANQLKLLYEVEADQPYKRIWSKPVFEFGQVYNDIDISVAPLEKNMFNSCKSELKMIEAGFMGCGVMVSKVEPYTLLMTKENSFDLNENSFYLWQRMILNNPNLLKDKASKLAEDVKKYDLNLLTNKRLEFYKEICK